MREVGGSRLPTDLLEDNIRKTMEGWMKLVNN